ncbi:hypothetical protein ACLOJK_013304 [Asimina triloba]
MILGDQKLKERFRTFSFFPPFVSNMDANPSQSHRKRPFPGYEQEDDDEEESLQRPTYLSLSLSLSLQNPLRRFDVRYDEVRISQLRVFLVPGYSLSSHRSPFRQKKVRFPKGKKARKEDEISVPKPAEDEPVDCTDPRLAAKERAKRRNEITAELFSEQGGGIDISAAEVHYEGNGNFVDDGILIEPFNLKQEMEEGYFDAAGNFVEYISEKEVKDAWLDSVEVDTKLAGKANANTDEVEEFQELSSEEIGKTKRRIADTLQPGETVLQALRRLTGISSDKRERMPEETKRIFDQLTEDSHNKQETKTLFLLHMTRYKSHAAFRFADVYHEKQEVFQREAEGYECLARDSLDMFGDDENDTPNQPANTDVMGSQPGTETAGNMLPEAAGGETQSDYIYDESSGYVGLDQSFPFLAIIRVLLNLYCYQNTVHITITAAVWATIMTRLQAYIAVPRQQNANGCVRRSHRAGGGSSKLTREALLGSLRLHKVKWLFSLTTLQAPLWLPGQSGQLLAISKSPSTLEEFAICNSSSKMGAVPSSPQHKPIKKYQSETNMFLVHK